MTDAPVFDPKVMEQLVDERSAARVEELKKNLATSLIGEKPVEPPKSWGDVARKEDIDRAVTQAISETEKRVFEKIEAEKQEQAKKNLETQQLTYAQTEAKVKVEWEDQSAQYREAVADGIIPDVSTELKSKVDAWQKGTGPALTQDELQDPGIRAFAEVRALHEKLKSEGKSTSFYRTIEKFYNKQPAGASAPVLGNSRAVSPKKGYTYDEIHRENTLSGKFRF